MKKKIIIIIQFQKQYYKMYEYKQHIFYKHEGNVDKNIKLSIILHITYSSYSLLYATSNSLLTITYLLFS